jgi:hypothetical protein
MPERSNTDFKKKLSMSAAKRAKRSGDGQHTRKSERASRKNARVDTLAIIVQGRTDVARGECVPHKQLHTSKTQSSCQCEQQAARARQGWPRSPEAPLKRWPLAKMCAEPSTYQNWSGSDEREEQDVLVGGTSPLGICLEPEPGLVALANRRAIDRVHLPRHRGRWWQGVLGQLVEEL